ncbi:hypothetical protein DYH09_33360, partial [bacterium CPR1]|nr:hypothetical protein [bacterium CPR1]
EAAGLRGDFFRNAVVGGIFGGHLSGYRVYVWPVGKGPRLPLLVDADQTEVTVEHVQSAQICDIWVTARDESGNESRPAGRARMGP